MFFAKFRRGTLCVDTNGMQRFFAPTFFELLYLFWLFRHFHHVPLNVLGDRDRSWVERVCSSGPGVPGDPELVIGVVDCDLPAPKKQAQPAQAFHPREAERTAR